MIQISDNWAIFSVGAVLGLLQWIFSNVVLKRIDRLDENIKAVESKNECAHKEIWIELHKIDKETSNRISAIETRCDLEGKVKQLLSTT